MKTFISYVIVAKVRLEALVGIFLDVFLRRKKKHNDYSRKTTSYQHRRNRIEMVVGVPSPGAIAEEEDLHLYDAALTNTNDGIPSSLCTIISPMECLPILAPDLPHFKSNKCPINPDDLPFDLLAGEELLDHADDLPDGNLYLTTYRLFLFSNKSCCSFINCPIRLIDALEMRDNIYIYIQCKDMRSFRLTFFIAEKCCLWLRKLNESIAIPTCLDDLFAMKFFSAIPPNQEHTIRDRFHDEIIRLQLDADPWRVTEINRNYDLCSSYPEFCVVPMAITDKELAEVAKFRSYRRFPTIVWR